MNCIIIPAFQPDQHLLALVEKLMIFKPNIIIINDGSDSSYFPLFQTLEQYHLVKVLHHSVNQGKGQALKTGFRYFLDNFSAHYPGVITADADGQHSSNDIQHICETFNHHKSTLLLGSRSFKKDVPWRSRWGNKITQFIFRIVVGQPLQDTQTGLRAIPREFLECLLKIRLMRYDFELEMLLWAFKQKIPFKEINIQTIYAEGNKHSHFHPLKDAIKIYFVFLRFIGKSLIDKMKVG